MTRLEQTIDEMARINRLIWSDIKRFVLFTNCDLFDAKIERKPLGEIYPDYRDDYLSQICEENIRARHFIFNELIANQCNFTDSYNWSEKLQCILHDVSRPFEAVLKDINQCITPYVYVDFI